MTPISPYTTFFAQHYQQARDKFRGAAVRAGARLQTFEHPTARGPADTPLAIDVARIGPANPDLSLVLISGTHGVEGYCGSACQVGFFETGLAAQLPDRSALICIHALNPYGFAWDRRVTEDNIDLNRNFRDHSLPPADNQAYAALAPFVELEEMSAATANDADAQLLAFAETHGFAALQHALSSGQYSHANGLYYGGRAPAWSNTIFRKIMAEHMAGTRRLVAIDFHTGLGLPGHGEIISMREADSPAFAEIKRIWGQSVTSTKDGSSVSADLTGTIDGAMDTILPHTETSFIGLEFGTIDPMSVFRATRADHWMHNYDQTETAQGRKIKADMRAAFYPNTDEWKRKVWARAHEVLGQALYAMRT